MSALSFDNVHKSYGQTRALRGVGFQVENGEVFGLLGPNGAGKTTLIRIMMDIVRADAGSVRIFDLPLRRQQLARVGYLPEEAGLYQRQRVLDVMVYFGRLKGLSRREAKRRSREWLELVGLPEVASHRVERLSKGMRQKVQLATTLLADPDLVVLDEPFAGLDPINVRFVENLISDRRQRGQTTILSTHQMNRVESLCDRVALINAGQLMVYGSVEDVRARYSQLEVRVALPSRPPDVPGVSAVNADGNGTWRLSLAPDTKPSDVLQRLVELGAPVDGFEKVLASLEDIFIRVVGKGAR